MNQITVGLLLSMNAVLVTSYIEWKQGRRNNSRAGGTEISKRALALVVTS